MPAQLGKSLVARRSNWDYTGKEEQKEDLTPGTGARVQAGENFAVLRDNPARQ